MYYTIVLVIAVILLIIGLTIVGVTLKSKKRKDFPEFSNTCPDYWTLEDANLCIPGDINIPAPDKYTGGTGSAVLHNGVIIGSNTVTSLNINNKNWTGICDKANWGKRNGVIWDGVTNNNIC